MRHETFSIIEVGLTELAGEPRCRDIELAERLGLEHPRNIRKLIERHKAELETFGPLLLTGAMVKIGSGAQREIAEYWLTEEQSLLVSALSAAPKAPAVRTMLIKVFVAWRRGNLPMNDGVVTELDASVRRAIGGIVKGVVHLEIASLLPKMVEAAMAETQITVVRGITAGEVIELAGVTDRSGTRGLPQAVSRMLYRFHVVSGVAVKLARLGMHTAYAFDPALCRQWLVDGGKEIILKRVQEKRGQGKLHLIGKMPRAPEPAAPPA